MNTLEQNLDKEIMIWCGKQGWLCFHTNVGSVMTADGRIFHTGLPKGWPDLMILKPDGAVFFCETKIHPRKPTADQLKMISLLKNYGFLAFVAYSLEEFVSNCLQEKR